MPGKIPLILSVSVQGNVTTTGDLRGVFYIPGECSNYCVKGTIKLTDLKINMRAGQNGIGINLRSDRRDLLFTFNTCSEQMGEMIAQGSKRKEFKDDNKLDYTVSAPLINAGANILNLFGADETVSKIRQAQRKALQVVKSAIQGVKRDQYWDDVDMILDYSIFSRK